jgi:tripartite-type tricarboxylate transporter receptor subunit TctC
VEACCREEIEEADQGVIRMKTLAHILLSSVFIAGSAFAQAPYPAKQVFITVGLQAGTGSDVAVRNYTEKMSASLGQQFIVANQSGGAGLLAVQTGVKAKPDGYNLVALSSAAVTTLPHLQQIGINALKDLVPIGVFVSFPSVISVNSNVPAKSIQEFIALVKKNPGKFTYASGGNGSVQHTAMEELKVRTGMDLLHIPYKGMAQATTDLVGGQVDCAIQGVVAVIPFANKQVRVLAWTGAKRYPVFPDLPTLHEAGITGYNFQSWTGLFGPAGLPREVITRLNNEMRKIASTSDLREKWAPQGMEVIDATPQQIEDTIRDEYERMGKLVKQANIKLE